MKTRFAVLDVFRGIFASFIVLFHMSFFSNTPVLNNPFIAGTDLFVDFFFVLSGFIISYNYPIIITTKSYCTFLKKRFYRLYPLHFTVLILYLLIELLKGLSSRYITIHQPINPDNTIFTFFTNLFLLNSIKWPGVDNVSWNNPSWSISAEMCSYVLYATITWWLSRKVKSTFRTIFYVLVLFSSVIALFLTTQTASLIYTYNYGFLRGFIGFFTGVLCYKTFQYFYPFINQQNKFFFTWVEILVLLLVLISIYFQTQWLQFSIIYEFFFFLTVFIFAFERGFISQHLIQQPFLRKIGLYSYSIYLTHGLINTLFNILAIRILNFDSSDYSYLFIANGILVFLVSSWSYYTIEKRFYKRTPAVSQTI